MTQSAPEARGGPSRGALIALVVVAVVAQAVVGFFALALGLAWPGPAWLYFTSVAQAVAGLLVIGWFVRRRRRTVLLVPVASAALTAALFWVAALVGAPGACSAEGRALFAELDPPTGLSLDLRGEVESGCLARFETEIPAADLLAHYEREFAEHGLTPVAGRVAHEGQAEGLAGERDGVVVELVVWEGEGGLGAVYVYDAA